MSEQNNREFVSYVQIACEKFSIHHYSGKIRRNVPKTYIRRFTKLVYNYGKDMYLELIPDRYQIPLGEYPFQIAYNTVFDDIIRLKGNLARNHETKDAQNSGSDFNRVINKYMDDYAHHVVFNVALGIILSDVENQEFLGIACKSSKIGKSSKNGKVNTLPIYIDTLQCLYRFSCEMLEEQYNRKISRLEFISQEPRITQKITSISLGNAPQLQNVPENKKYSDENRNEILGDFEDPRNDFTAEDSHSPQNQLLQKKENEKSDFYLVFDESLIEKCEQENGEHRNNML